MNAVNEEIVFAVKSRIDVERNPRRHNSGLWNEDLEAERQVGLRKQGHHLLAVDDQLESVIPATSGHFPDDRWGRFDWTAGLGSVLGFVEPVLHALVDVVEGVAEAVLIECRLEI